MEKIIGVVGPTASGKTAFAIRLAKARGGEVVSCDSMQIYRHMDIGTAKPTPEEMEGIPHHMLDVAEPDEPYSVARYVQEARRVIAQIHERGRLPILCGGTGLYFDSLIQNIQFSEMPADPAYRDTLFEMAKEKGAEAVYALLKDIDPAAAAATHPNNLKRVIRALEIWHATGKTKTELDLQSQGAPLYDAEVYGMAVPRAQLYERINQRVDRMIQDGLIDEVRRLLEMGVPREATAMQAIGYKELVAYLDGACDLAAAVEKIKQESRRYAKRQMTWFRRNKAIQWIEIL